MDFMIAVTAMQHNPTAAGFGILAGLILMIGAGIYGKIKFGRFFWYV